MKPTQSRFQTLTEAAKGDRGGRGEEHVDIHIQVQRPSSRPRRGSNPRWR